MEIVLGIVIVLFVLVGIFFLSKVNRNNNNSEETKEVSAPASDCCGAHEVCDFDEIKADETIIEYYDDEELDEFQNIPENAYTDNQIEQFREVLYTLKTKEIRYWLLSIERRKINLPSILVNESRLLMAEA